MSKIDDGGPAFPSELYNLGPMEGMSLRDYFAIKASEEDIRLYLKSGEYNFFRSMRERTAARYAFANAMIAQRKEQ